LPLLYLGIYVTISWYEQFEISYGIQSPNPNSSEILCKHTLAVVKFFVSLLYNNSTRKVVYINLNNCQLLFLSYEHVYFSSETQPSRIKFRTYFAVTMYEYTFYCGITALNFSRLTSIKLWNITIRLVQQS
jgi:hypothetical protein